MQKSAGLLVYRFNDNAIEFFLVHPGGPFWKGKDAGAWSIPKGEYSDDEDPLTAAKREFKEETGQDVDGNFIELKPVKQKSGKMVYAWAVEANPDETKIISNTFQLEYPPKSGRMITIPEVDKAAWFNLGIAKEKMNPAQIGLIEEVMTKLNRQ